jgi:hypothetical protein
MLVSQAQWHRVALKTARVRKTRKPISLRNMRLRPARKAGKQRYQETETRHEGIVSTV